MTGRLREALREMADQARSYEVHETAVEKAVETARWRRGWVGVAVVAVVVALIPVLVSLVRVDSPQVPERVLGRLWPPLVLRVADPTRTPTTRGSLDFTVLPGTVDNVTVTPLSVTPTVQEARIESGGTGSLFVFEPGTFDPSEMLDGTAIPLRSGTGYLRMTLLPATMAGPRRGTAEPALAWQYGPGAWAVAYGGFGQRAEYTGSVEEPPGLSHEPPRQLLAVANGLSVGSPTPGRLAFSLSYIPDGLRATSLDGVPRADQLNCSVSFSRRGLDRLFMDAAAAVDLSVAGHPGPLPGWAVTDVIAGRDAMRKGNGYVVDFDGYFLEIQGTLAHAEADRVIAGIRLANWRDPAAWYPADTAVPGE